MPSIRFALVVLAGGLGFGFAGCASATRPDSVKVEVTHALGADETMNTDLARSIAPHRPVGSGESLFHPLALGTEAFVARLGLARAAQRSLDVQYYMIHTDGTGLALFRELLHAADRGVRVRLLIDDIHTEGEDPLLAALDAHPQIEVRVFNPFRRRSARWLDFLFDYRRVNRRMHNKSITADNEATIVGGRNVGDEYFAADSELDFSDLDVLAAGPVVPEVSAEFDRYWNSSVVWPVSALLAAPLEAAAVRAQYDRLEQSMAVEKETAYARELPNLELVRAIEAKRLVVFPGTCIVIADPPEKVTQPVSESAHAIMRLKDIMEKTRRELILVSPYFVPGKQGTAWLVALARRGVKVRILTNSYLATDVGAVHSGYMAYRPKLLKAGVEIYEMKPNAYAGLPSDPALGAVKGSQASLHAKTYVMDRRTIFIGSLNLDPRSAHLNTEMGLAVDSPGLAGLFTDRFDPKVMNFAYRVERHADGTTTWTTRENGQEVVVNREPGVGPMKRIGLFIMRVLPVEEQL